jgi:LuxR family maltose regulon positive regulatory protein
MLDGLPQDIVQFMLRTAILDRFSAPLCQAVTGTGTSQDLLKAVESHQLLLAPLDQEGQSYRYHLLLAEHLRERLETQFGDEILLLPTPFHTSSGDGFLLKGWELWA